MHVQQLMTPQAIACTPDTNLCEAIGQMWDADVGALPVVDDAGHPLGIVTDRDISIALCTRNRLPSQVNVADVMTTPVRTCRQADDIPSALRTMREYRIRRLPVVDDEGRLCGMFTLNDAILSAGEAISGEQVLETMQAICEHAKPSETPLAITT